MGFDTLFQPAIKVAEDGYLVAPRIAFDWKNGFDKLKNGTNSERYLLPGGKPALDNPCQLIGLWGGIIEVTVPGQFSEMIP